MAERKWTDQDGMEAALKPFGWTMGDEFWRRYYSDPWVFNLANAVERLTKMRKVSRQNAKTREALRDAVYGVLLANWYRFAADGTRNSPEGFCTIHADDIADAILARFNVEAI